MNTLPYTGNPGPAGNAYKHGFDALDHIFLSRLLPYERGIIDELRESLYAYYNPQTLIEQLLVDRITIHHFRLFRFYRLEFNSINASMNHDPSGETILPSLDRLSRYDSRITHHLNSLQQTLRAAQRNREHLQQESQAENQPAQN